MIKRYVSSAEMTGSVVKREGRSILKPCVASLNGDRMNLDEMFGFGPYSSYIFICNNRKLKANIIYLTSGRFFSYFYAVKRNSSI